MPRKYQRYTGSKGVIRRGPSRPTCVPSLSALGAAVWKLYAKNAYVGLGYFRAKYLPCKRVFLRLPRKYERYTGSKGVIRRGPSRPTCVPSLSALGAAVWTLHAKNACFPLRPIETQWDAIFEVTRKLKEIKSPNLAVRLVARGRACLQSADRLVTSPTSERRQRFPYMFYIRMHWSVRRSPVASAPEVTVPFVADHCALLACQV